MDDYEVADVRWLPVAAALQKIEFTNERLILQKALDILGAGAPSAQSEAEAEGGQGDTGSADVPPARAEEGSG